YNEAVKDEENMLYQQAKVEWLKEGDKNFAYFHQDVPDQFVAHFQKFFGKGGNVKGISNKEDLFKMTVSSNEAKDMCRNITEEEINDALSSFDDNKAPGPDGFTSKFFKAAWSIAGRDVYDVVKEFFQIGKFLSEINAKLITLVPKVKAHLKVSEYRPITSCNVFFKIVSKILTSRLKAFLRRVISENQSAFIPGRSIADNIMLTQEI
nr:hypothetical protein [Tanacetum cinerariifolium]